jgi:hypothetical protein
VDVADSVNAQGVLLQWDDTGFRFCKSFLQPVRVFRVVVPQGTRAELQIVNVRAHGRSQGLPGRAERLQPQEDSPRMVWAELDRSDLWRGFRLARVLVYAQVGDARTSQVLEEIHLRVTFTGTPVRPASRERDRDLLSLLAVNGADGARWWSESAARHVLDDAAAWPSFPLHRITVTDVGLYKIVGSSPEIADLVGQPSSRIKMFGNGGRLLQKSPLAAVDTALHEDAIRVEDGGDGRFDAQDSILFFARGLKGADYCDGTYLANVAHQSPFSTENVFFLGADPSGSDGLRMASLGASGTPSATIDTSVVTEYLDNDNFIYSGGEEAESGLIWYMATVGAGQERSLALNLAGATGSAGTLRVVMENVGDVGALFSIYMNNTLVDSNRYANDLTRSIPPATLTDGGNVVRFVNRSAATVYINFIEVKYTRRLTTSADAFEFSAPANQSGLFHYQVTGLNSDGLIVDVTDALRPRLARGNSFNDTTRASAARRYFAVASGDVRAPIFRGLSNRPANLDYTALRSPQNEAGIIILTFDDGYEALDSLRQFHETYREEPLHAVRVRLSDVYDEFGWGVHDVMAIRNFLKYAFQNWRGSSGTADAPKYVLFVGGGNYDYRNLVSGGKATLMPPWEFIDTCRDDFFGIFSSTDDYTIPEICLGRWPVQNVEELGNIARKTIAYATKPLYGPWKNTATFAADDEWKNGCSNESDHTAQCENLTRTVLPPYFTFKKVYEIFYPFRSSPLGGIKPDATRDLIEAINRGTLIVHFAGHGNERVWTDEQMFVMDRDQNLLENDRTWPLFFAATCTWGGYDKPIGRCFPEILLADRTQGSICCIAATRFTFIGPNDIIANTFYTDLFRPGLALRRSFGNALLAAKGAYISGSLPYHVLGDPVLRLATPEYFADVTSPPDSLQALSLYHLSGAVLRSDSGQVWQDFNGLVEARVYDTEDSIAYYWCGNTSQPPYWVMQPGNAIFRGTATVENGRFNVTFRVPRDVRYGGTNAKVSLYFYGRSGSEADSADGVRVREHLPIAAEASAERDSVAPVINPWLEYPSFRPGDLVSSTPRLHVGLVDSSGINLSGEVGHKITVRVDDAQAEDLTPFFNYDRDSYTSGSLDKTIGPLAEGNHRLIIEAWDSFNNLSQGSMTFNVGQSGEAGYEIRDVLAFPNPMKDVTCFTYLLTQDGTRRVSLKVFTLSGKLVYDMDNLGTRGPAFNSNSDRPWDGRDREGHMLANGVYFFRIRAEQTNGRTAEATGKLVILR